MEEYLFVTQDEVRLHRVQPDVTISTTRPGDRATASAVAVAEPTTAELDYPDYEPHTQRHLKWSTSYRAGS